MRTRVWSALAALASAAPGWAAARPALTIWCARRWRGDPAGRSCAAQKRYEAALDSATRPPQPPPCPVGLAAASHSPAGLDPAPPMSVSWGPQNALRRQAQTARRCVAPQPVEADARKIQQYLAVPVSVRSQVTPGFSPPTTPTPCSKSSPKAKPDPVVLQVLWHRSLDMLKAQPRSPSWKPALPKSSRIATRPRRSSTPCSTASPARRSAFPRTPKRSLCA